MRRLTYMQTTLRLLVVILMALAIVLTPAMIAPLCIAAGQPLLVLFAAGCFVAAVLV